MALSPSSLRHICSREKVSCYPNVVFSVILHFGLECRIIEDFQRRWPMSMLNEMFLVDLTKIHEYEETFVSGGGGCNYIG